MPMLHLSVLGDPRLSDSDGRALVGPGPKALALLACLASAPDLRMHRSVLAELVWGDAASSSAARHALRQCLVRLRKQLAGLAGVLGADDSSVWLNPDLVVLDLIEVQAALCSETAEQVIAQSDAVRGRFCAGLDLGIAEFDHWLRARQGECDRLCAELHGKAAMFLAERGDGRAAIAAARRRVELEPFQDDAHAALITLCCSLGRRQTAAEAHSACHRLFRDELGLPPAPEVDAALKTPARIRRGLVPLALPGNAIAPRRGHRAVAAFLAGGLAAAILLQSSGPRSAAPVTPSQPARASLWISAASAAPAQTARNGWHVSHLSNLQKGEGDHDANTDYAMLYPAGC